MTNVAIQTEDVTRAFGDLRAVDRLTLEVPRGMIFGFLGPNGAGKTTTLRLLLGLLEPTEGQAEVLGLDVRTRGDEIRAQTGALLEHAGLYERLSAYDNLAFYARIWRMEAGEREARIEELLTHLDLWERRKEAVKNWSRGMRQKLAIARTLLHRPSLVFLDEPTAGLDPVAAAALREDLAGLVEREGVTVFLTTHNLTEAERLCAQVAVIRQGRLMAQGSPHDLSARSSAPRLEVTGRGFTDEALTGIQDRAEVVAVEQGPDRLLIELRETVDSAPLIAQLVGAGVEVEEVRKGNATLEEVFLTLMEEEV